jgi:hypothetical protein
VRPPEPEVRLARSPGSAWDEVTRSAPLGLLAPSFALKTPGLPLSFVLKALDLLFSLVLKVVDLPLVPGSQTPEGAGPVLLAQPRQGRHRDDTHDHPLIKAAASQHMNQPSQPDQSQRGPIIRT